MLKFALIIFLEFAALAPAKASETMSEEDKNTAYELANQYSICGGTYYAVSEFMKANGKVNAAAELKAQGNGRYMAGAWLLFSSGIIPNWQNALRYAEGPALNEKQHLLAILEGSKNLEADLKSMTDTIHGICAAIDDYQKELVSEMRKYMYEHGTQKPN